MRLEDLAARLVSVEAKLATLTGTSVTLNNATSIEELDARLSIVEVHVNQLITVKIQSQIETKKKQGQNEQMAMMQVKRENQAEIQKLMAVWQSKQK